MFTKRIIPCLDVNKGRVVKGVNCVNLREAGDPVEIGAAYDKAGADELVFLDITASSDNRNTVCLLYTSMCIRDRLRAVQVVIKSAAALHEQGRGYPL